MTSIFVPILLSADLKIINHTSKWTTPICKSYIYKIIQHSILFPNITYHVAHKKLQPFYLSRLSRILVLPYKGTNLIGL